VYRGGVRRTPQPFQPAAGSGITGASDLIRPDHREDPHKDLVDYGVLGQAVLPGRTCGSLGEPPLRHLIEMPVAGIGPQPVPKQPVPDRFGRTLRPHVQVYILFPADHHPVAVPPGFAEHEPIPELLQ
jgi:hypothetical protein